MTEKILVERDRIVSAIANVEKSLSELERMVDTRGITRQRADLISAQCREELRRLTDRLEDLDASIAETRVVAKVVRGR